MADARAATVTTAHKGPEGQRTTGRRIAVLADCRAMLKAIEGELARLDRRVEAASDPQENARRVPAATETEGFVPMSRPRVQRVDIENEVVPLLLTARAVMADALAAAGVNWTD